MSRAKRSLAVLKSSVRIILLMMVYFSTPTWAQEKPTFRVPTPEGWREDVMRLPPDFAPNLSWTGWEITEFSPGMFNAEESDFFSYVFLLKIEESDPDWDEQLLIYHRGLAKAVLEDPQLDVSDFEVSLEGKPEARYGTVKWLEPFVTKKAQTLHFECRQIGDGLWFVCASPKSWDWPIWTEMRRIRFEFEYSIAGTQL